MWNISTETKGQDYVLTLFYRGLFQECDLRGGVCALKNMGKAVIVIIARNMADFSQMWLHRAIAHDC